MNIPLIIFTYLVFKFTQFLFAFVTDEPTIDIIAYAVGFGIPAILTFFSFRNISFFKWLMTLTIIAGGISTLYSGIFIFSTGQLLSKIFAIVFGGYLSIGSYFLIVKTKNKEKWA